MSVAACLLLYGLAVIVFAPPLLVPLTRSGNAPRLGVAVWLTAIGSVLITWMAAAILVIIDVAGHWNQRGMLVASCVGRLRGVVAGDDGVAPQSLVLAVAIAAAGAAAVISGRLARTMVRLRARAHEHAQAVRLVGQRTGEADLVVVDAAEPAAYCVSGRPPAIVVTTAAVAVLDQYQLGAVLAHERAHLAGHHPRVVATLRSLATVFRRLPLMTQGAAEVSRLLEMCADDTAASRHGNRVLLSGLIALAGAAPAEALAAADLAVLSRAQRLTTPPSHYARVRTQVALTSALAIMAAGPLLITTMLVAPGAGMCGA